MKCYVICYILSLEGVHCSLRVLVFFFFSLVLGLLWWEVIRNLCRLTKIITLCLLKYIRGWEATTCICLPDDLCMCVWKLHTNGDVTVAFVVNFIIQIRIRHFIAELIKIKLPLTARFTYNFEGPCNKLKSHCTCIHGTGTYKLHML